jgi:hypothetical protein
VDTAGRIWEGDPVQLATKEVRLTLILWVYGAGGSRRAAEGTSASIFAAGVVSVMLMPRQLSAHSVVSASSWDISELPTIQELSHGCAPPAYFKPSSPSYCRITP